MAIAQNSSILAADYNGIQSAVQSTLGTGSGDRGYGQAVTSSQVSAGNSITAQHMINLKTDIDKISYHQTNAASSAPAVSVGGTILASDWATYNTQITNLTSSRLTIFGVGQEGTSPVTTAQSTWLLDVVTSSISNWNGDRTHVVTVNFGSADAARYFFNTGGEIRIVPRHSGNSSSTTKGGRWKAIFDFIGAKGVRIGANATTAPTSTAPSYTAATYVGGYYQLTTTAQKIYEVIDFGLYSGNDFNVTARTTSTPGEIIINIMFRDDTPLEPAGARTIDDAVDGTTTSSVGSFRATGSYVSVAAPTITAVAM